MASDIKKETKATTKATIEEVSEEVKNEVKADPVITLKESELNQKLQIAYDRGRVAMLVAIKSDITKYFDDTLLSYIPN